MTESVVAPGMSARREESTTGASLRVIVALLRRLDEEGIAYCHWKSNEHLDRSMAGTADLDMLVDRRCAVELAGVLAALGFKRLLSGPGRGYPGIEDYVGFDRGTGRLTHLHVHYQLTVGEKHLKGYRLPWERVALDSRVRDEQFGVYVTNPIVELLLLLVRCAMKARTRDYLAQSLGRGHLRGSPFVEFRWLVARIHDTSMNHVATDLLGERGARVVREIITGGRPSLRQLRQLRRHATPNWREYRMYPAWEAAVRRWLREARAHARRFGRRVGRRLGGADAYTCPRTPPSGGLIAALVGPDGAGKSTVAAEVIRWLSREVAVVSLYGGSGSGPASLLRLGLQRAARLARAALGRRQRASEARQAPRAGPSDADAVPHHSGVRALAYAAWALSLAGERRRNARRARRARDRGQVVIADRFPQTQFSGVNDGPKLVAWRDHRSPLLRWAAAVEQSAFRSINVAAPDLVVKLQLPPEVALQRKPDTPADRLRRKVEVVRLLRYPAATRVVEVDAGQPLDEVVLQVKKAVWESL